MEVSAEYTISNIPINPAQREVEKTPSEPFLPPKAGGTFEVDQSVIAGMEDTSDDPATVIDSYYSLSCHWI